MVLIQSKFTMSVQDCYNRDARNCTRNERTNETDNLCALEFNPDRQNPTCVPADPNMFHVPRGHEPTLTVRESDFLQLLLVRLLPSDSAANANAVVTADELKQS